MEIATRRVDVNQVAILLGTIIANLGNNNIDFIYKINRNHPRHPNREILILCKKYAFHVVFN